MSYVTVTFEEAVKMLPDSDRIHTTIDRGAMLLGDEWPREKVIAALLKAPFIALTEGAAKACGDGLAVLDADVGRLFIRTRKE